MEKDRVLILAFNKQTGVREQLTSCLKPNAEFYRRKYELEGYETWVGTFEEARELAKVREL